MTFVLCIFTAYLNRHGSDLKRSGVDRDCRRRRGDRLAVVHPLDGRQREPGSRTGQLEFGSLRNRFVEVRPAAEFRRNENGIGGGTEKGFVVPELDAVVQIRSPVPLVLLAEDQSEQPDLKFKFYAGFESL